MKTEMLKKKHTTGYYNNTFNMNLKILIKSGILLNLFVQRAAYSYRT